MSTEAAKAFYEKTRQDEKITEHLKTLGTEEAIREYVQSEFGYEFTREEMQQVIFENNPELSDEELEAVTGGSGMLALVLVMAGAPAWLGALVAAA